MNSRSFCSYVVYLLMYVKIWIIFKVFKKKVRFIYFNIKVKNFCWLKKKLYIGRLFFFLFAIFFIVITGNLLNFRCIACEVSLLWYTLLQPIQQYTKFSRIEFEFIKYRIRFCYKNFLRVHELVRIFLVHVLPLTTFTKYISTRENL